MPDPTFEQRRRAYLAEGLTVVVIPGASTNDRGPITGRPAGPKVGLTWHHIGAETSDPAKYAATVLFNGYAGLPGPLCADGLDVDAGVIYMVGNGRTNHAGGGDPVVLARVKDGTVPLDRELKPTKGNSDGVDGNGPLTGIEMMYSGGRPLPAKGYTAMIKWSAANLRLLGRNARSAVGHREWSDDKPDPGMVDLPKARRDTNAALALPPGVWGTTPPPPKPVPVQEDDMPVFVSTTPNEGGRIYMLVAGRPKLWLNPTQWALWRRQAPAATDLAAHGSPYLEVEVDVLWASIQPEGSVRDGVPEAVLDGDQGVTTEDVGNAPDCAEPREHNS